LKSTCTVLVWSLGLTRSLTVVTTYTTLFQHLLYASMSEGFPEQFRLFLSASLTAFADEMEGEGLEAQSDAAGPGPGPGPGPSSKRKKAAAPSPHFHRLTVLPRYSTTLLRVAYDEIEKIAQEEAAVGWEEKRLGAARQRLSETVVPWMSGVFESEYS
jgi:anaphase-promoting complex subunit 2